MGESKYSIERGFLSKLIETKDMKVLKDLQIRPSFLTGDNKRVFLFIQKTFQETGELPTPRVINKKFPTYKLETHSDGEEEVVGTDESLLYWCGELRTKAKHNKLAEVTESVAKLLDTGDTEDAYSEMKKGVWKIEDDIVESSSVDITKDTEDRKKAYLERKMNKGMMGIPTGIQHLDYVMKGLCKETLTTIIAQPGVGKTWFLVLISAYAQLNNYKVVMFVTEMSTDLMRDRYDAMLFSMMNGDFSYSKFKSGGLSKKEEEDYFDFLENDLPYLEPLVIETAIGVSSIVATIEQEKPDLVVIDGVYLMEDDQGAKDDWLRVAHITRDLKKTAKQRHIPIVVNTQADKNTSKKTGPELGSIMYTQSVGQDCLPEDSLVLIEQGYRRIQLLENEVFKVFDGENLKKATCSYAGVKELTIIKYRGNEFKCSPNHKMYIYDNEVGDFVWKRAKDLEPLNDYLLEQNFSTDCGFDHVLRVEEFDSENIKIPLEATRDLGVFIGMFVAEGFLKYSKGQVTIQCGTDIQRALLCSNLGLRIFGIEGLISFERLATNVKNYTVVWNSKTLVEWVRFFCCDESLEPTIKLDFCEMNKDIRLGIVSGLLQSSIVINGQSHLNSLSDKVLKGLNLILKTLGVATQCVNVSKMNLLQVLDMDINKLANISIPNKNHTPIGYFANTLNPLFKMIGVDSVENTKETKPMWDIQVFDSDKRIITNGIVNHNSDNVLAMFRDEVMIQDKEMGLKILKQREGILAKIVLSWNFDKMSFGSIYNETESQDEEISNEDMNSNIIEVN